MRPRPNKPVATPESRAPRATIPGGIRVAIRLISSRLTVRGWARNLSEGGMFVETDTPFPADAEVELDWLMREEDTPHHLKVRGWVVHGGDTGMGFQFDEESAAPYEVIPRAVQNLLANSGK